MMIDPGAVTVEVVVVGTSDGDAVGSEAERKEGDVDVVRLLDVEVDADTLELGDLTNWLNTRWITDALRFLFAGLDDESASLDGVVGGGGIKLSTRRRTQQPERDFRV